MPLPPSSHLATLENFGHSLNAPAYVYKVRGADEILRVIKLAKKNNLTLTARGAGRSYNDASLNGGGLVLDMTGMDNILKWDPQSGIITVEPGVTIQKLWQHVLPDGWWPPVVSGTMMTTLGGCLSSNVHGKNNFRMGPIGEHVLEFSALLPTGAEVTCSPKKNGDLFRAMISGMGMLGIFTSITLQMKKMHSGLLNVSAWKKNNLESGLDHLFENAPHYDYIVGWVDCMARGRGLGRGQVHAANYLPAGEDSNAAETMRLDYQKQSSKVLGVLPKSALPIFMRPFVNNLFWRGVNTAKYLTAREHHFQQSHAAFHFLLDYIPSWERAAGNGGLIQYQSFLPKETALQAWTEILTLAHKRSLPAYLGVTKRHRPDNFLLTHSVDGFSLAMDFKITNANRAELSKMLQDFDQIVLDAGGRFYFAKNSETSAQSARRFLGDATVEKFRKLKKRCDPDGVLESNLYRRLFGHS